MKKSDQLKQTRASKVTAQKDMLDARKAEKRDAFNEEETTKFNALTTEIEALDAQIRQAITEEAAEARAAAFTAPVVPVSSGGDVDEKNKVFKRASIIKAINAASPGNATKLTGAEKEMHEIGLEESRNAGVTVPSESRLSIPLSYLSRASQQTATQDAGAFGGALVQNQAPQMVAPLRPKLVLEDLGATFLTGLSGGNIPLIVDNDFAMSFLAEGAAITPQKKEFAGPTLNPKRAGGAVDISNQLLMQSSVDVDERVANGLRTGFAQLLHGACINGAGGVAPTGLLNLPGVNVAAGATAAAATWAKIVELQGLIEEDNATMDNLGYLLHPKLKAALKTIKKDAGSGRFLFEGTQIDATNTLVSSLMPVLDAAGTNVYPLIYGDFSQMVIGQWGSINVTVNPYSADLSDSVRLVLNTHADMQVANQKAFAKNAFLTA